MPGHKGSDIYSRFGYNGFLKDFPNRDITEISGADNLFQPEGIIADTMSKYRALYETKATYLLINGSSAGIIASMMTCAGSGEKIIMARNCHKAAFNALRLGNIDPVYVYPEMIDEYGIAGRVDPETIAFAIRENPDAKAIILPSPNYYGICSDIKAIADLAHEAGMRLIVDQAHGAHLKFFEGAGPHIPMCAESAGADLVINSTHKTLASMTQSAVLNVCGGGVEENGMDQVDFFDLEDKLQMIQSTSPSYILMESLDINADIIREHGRDLIAEWYEDLTDFYGEAERIPGLKVMRTEGLDITKINLDMSELGLDGAALDEELMKRNIYAELSTGNILMCMTGIGNTADDYGKLLEALKEISASRSVEHTRDEDQSAGTGGPDAGGPDAAVWTLKRRMEQIPQKKELISLDEAGGRICATALIPYPPGIPLICPGEEITEEDVEHIRTLRDRGEKVIGVSPKGQIAVGVVR